VLLEATVDGGEPFVVAVGHLSVTLPDTTGPTVTITSATPDPTNQSPFTITVAFSEVVTG